MRRAILAAILTSAAIAHAAPGELPAAPTGWALDAARAQALETRLRGDGHFGGAQLLAAETRVAVGDAGSLSAWRLATPAPQPDRPRGVRAELELLRGSATPPAGAASALAVWQERVVERVVEAQLSWRRAADKIDVRTRVLIAATAQGVTAVGAECALRDGAPPAAHAACDRFLDALEPAVAAADRADLAVAGAPELAPAAPPVAAPAAPAVPDRSPPPSMREGDSLPRVAPPPPSEPAGDRRPFLVAGGALVLVALLLWNRGKRRAIEASHGPTAPRRRFRPRAGDDADADALADAALAEAEAEAPADPAAAASPAAPPPPRKDPP